MSAAPCADHAAEVSAVAALLSAAPAEAVPAALLPRLVELRVVPPAATAPPARAVVLRAVAERLFRPLLANLLRAPTALDRVGSIAATQPLLALATACLPGTVELLALAGFALDAATGRFAIAAAAADVPRLHAADRAVDDALAAVDAAERRDAAARSGGGAPPSVAAVPLRSAAAERQAALAAIAAQIEADRAALAARRAAEEAAAKAAADGQAADFAAGAPLLETCRTTLHYSGRLRNAAFEGTDFSVRAMRHGRGFACDCPGENLEVHWHTQTANLLYSFVVHLSPDGKSVVHQCPELGYQYNSVPHTANFQKTVLITRKMVLPDGRLAHEEPNTVAAACAVCLVDFAQLWK